MSIDTGVVDRGELLDVTGHDVTTQLNEELKTSEMARASSNVQRGNLLANGTGTNIWIGCVL